MTKFSASEPVSVDPSRLLAAFAQLRDPRAGRGVRYQFAHLVLTMVCSVLAGAKTLVEMAEWAADTARTELTACGIGAPHATTLARVFERLESNAFDLLAADWAQDLGRPAAIAVDGKEMRGAKNGSGSRIRLSSIEQNTNAVLAKVALGEKATRFCSSRC
ncbi:transposase family protein [Paeniglutamicibacter sp. Y32M11]|uniref:transposase family protein n=1 Tax=Paeniglutamicibacter sp. Y32M11 TaxID=2853258 RepID=UPI001C530676|nr:transposase family protein [Paeniglutamicibacter sp. Y32M11]QXQ09637.1 transposase family protein [Paeniglutamicibacter sp. Y32M11]